MGIFYRPPANCQVPNLGGKWEALFGRRTSGVFVEVGGYDGESFSNTSCLADVGWSGLYIEPIAEFAQRCRLRHVKNPDVRVLERAVSDASGEIDIHVGDTLTTIVGEQVLDYEKIDWAKGLHRGETRRVPMERLDIILEREGIDPGFDVLVIDVEGAEPQVMAGFDVGRWRPKVILVELEDDHPDFRTNQRVVEGVMAVRKRIEEADYAPYFKDAINTLYVRRDILAAASAEIDRTSLPPARLFIGLPTFNRPDLLEASLSSLLNQSYRDFDLLISDNASTDPRVRSMCLVISAADPRVEYVQQPNNIGLEPNFWWVVDRAKSELYMWGSDDDIWKPDYLAKAVAALDENPHIAAWTSHLEVINLRGAIIRSIPNLARFSSSSLKIIDLARYVFDAEVQGKANIFSSVYRRSELLKYFGEVKGKIDGWGVDMIFVYGFICRYGLKVDPEALYLKRAHIDGESFHIDNPRRFIVPRNEARRYYDRYAAVAEGTRYQFVTKVLTRIRDLYDTAYARLIFGEKLSWH